MNNQKQRSEDLKNKVGQELFEVVDSIANQLKGTNTLVALLSHHGKMTVPRSKLMELIEIEQVWPNDFIYNHGSMMAITYDQDTDEFGFELGYESDNNAPENCLGYTCTRNQTKVGFVDHDSPLYKK